MPFWLHEHGPGLLALPKEPPFMDCSFIQQSATERSLTLCPASVPPAAAPLWPPEVSADRALRDVTAGDSERLLQTSSHSLNAELDEPEREGVGRGKWGALSQGSAAVGSGLLSP